MKAKYRLVPGQAVELLVGDGEYAGRYRTHAEEVGEKVISIIAPYFQGQVIPLREGMPVEVVFWDEVSAYRFQAVIMHRIAVPVPLFLLELRAEIQKIQRRNYVRVPAFYPLTYQAVTRVGLSDAKKANLMDLSGGGLRIHTDEKLQHGDILEMHLELPTGIAHPVGRVCRVETLDNPKEYAVSVTFHEITERERDRIIRCVFHIQRVMRRKGLV